MNAFEMNKDALTESETNSQKYDLKVFTIKSNYGPNAGGNITNSQVSYQNYNNMQYGFSASELDSNYYIESEGNQPHPQEGDNLDIFKGFRNWWHVNVTGNSRFFGGLGLGDQGNGNGNQKINHDRRHGRGNASSPTMMDPKTGLYGKSGKGDGMLLMNMTQITRSDIRSKQQKIRDSNSNSNVQIGPQGSENEFQQRDTLVFNDTNQQSSSEYPSHTRDVMPQSIFGKSQQNFNLSMSNNRNNDNLSGRQNHLRTSNISDQQKKMMRPGQ